MGLAGDAFKGVVGVAYKGTVGLIGIGYGLGVSKQILDDIVEGIDEGQKLSLSKMKRKTLLLHRTVASQQKKTF